MSKTKEFFQIRDGELFRYNCTVWKRERGRFENVCVFVHTLNGKTHYNAIAVADEVGTLTGKRVNHRAAHFADFVRVEPIDPSTSNPPTDTPDT